jgi:TM2 domain-containing membrane protein YozV
MSESATRLTSDTKALLRFETAKKSAGVAYLLWFFLGMLGAHRFYLGRGGSGAAQLILTIVGLVTLVVVVGAVILGCVGIWVLIDLFLIGGWVKIHNLELLQTLGA